MVTVSIDGSSIQALSHSASLDLRVGPSLHSSTEPSELTHWTGHNESTIDIDMICKYFCYVIVAGLLKSDGLIFMNVTRNC